MSISAIPLSMVTAVMPSSKSTRRFYFSTMPLPFESREEVLAWICKNQLGRRNLTPEQKKFLIGKQYSVEHRKPGGNGNNQHTAAAKKTDIVNIS